MANPVFNDRFFDTQRAGTAYVDVTATEHGLRGSSTTGYGAPTTTATRSMTYGGVTSAAGVMLLFVLIAGWFGWNQVTERVVETIEGPVLTADLPTGWVFGSLAVGFVLALVCAFRPMTARFLAIPYSIAQGVFLGAISHTYDIRTEGVVMRAVLATIAVAAVMFGLYGFRVLRVTPRMTKAIISATLGVMFVYLIAFVSSFFTSAGTDFLHSTSGLSILLSVVVAGLAAFNLLLDFDFIERGVNARLPKHMEWFAAFGLMVTIIWLYLELLRLFSKLQRD